MKLVVAAVGRMKSGPGAALWATFQKRVVRQGRGIGISALDIREIPESRRAGAAERREQEAARLLACAQGGVILALDEAGEMVTSRQFSRLLATRLESGAQQLTFLIGGPDGLAPRACEAADRVVSLGAMTWPHQIARVLLAEQLYRAVTILTNHPYHRE